MRDKLLKQGSDATSRAINHYLEREYDQFFIQAGMSFELLGKSRLAAIHPSLIMDKDFDSLLHACGAGRHTKQASWKIKTITAPDVLRRCIQLHPELASSEPRLRLLAEYRNSTIHLGEVPETEIAQIFRAYLAAISVILKGQDLEPGEIFGEFTEMVSAQLNESLAEVNRVVKGKIARALFGLQTRYATLDPEQLNTLIKVIESGYKLEKYTTSLVPCPACGNSGITRGYCDLDYGYDEHGMQHNTNPIVMLNPSHFLCSICSLELDGTPEMEAAGLGQPIEIHDVDLADFYEEPVEIHDVDPTPDY